MDDTSSYLSPWAAVSGRHSYNLRMQFEQITIVGVGLIGGWSVSRELQDRPAVVESAGDRGSLACSRTRLIDAYEPTPQGVGTAELVVHTGRLHRGCQ